MLEVVSQPIPTWLRLLLNIYVSICTILHFYLNFLSLKVTSFTWSRHDRLFLIYNSTKVYIFIYSSTKVYIFIWNVHLFLKVTSDLIPTWSRSHKTVALSSFCNFPLSGYLGNAKNYFRKNIGSSHTYTGKWRSNVKHQS